MKSVKISRSQIEMLYGVLKRLIKNEVPYSVEKDARVILNKLEKCLIEIEKGELK